MLNQIKLLFIALLCFPGLMLAIDDVGFLNIVNGTDREIKITADAKDIVPSLAAGAMTGGLVLPVGSVRVRAEVEGLKDKFSLIVISKNSSLLAIVTLTKSIENPDDDVLSIRGIPYRATSSGGYSAGVVYAGGANACEIQIGEKSVSLKKYEYVDLGSVSPTFSFKKSDGLSFEAEFGERLHYTLFLLDGNRNSKANVLVVPNVAFSVPIFD